jgi:hypothetical protein
VATEALGPGQRPSVPQEEKQEEKLKAYEELCISYRAIDDFRAKLLGFLPVATGTGLFLLFNNLNELGLDKVKEFLFPIGVFGFAITLGLLSYEIYGIRKCHALIEAGQQIEGSLHIDGQFRERPQNVARVINEPFAAGIIYPAVLAVWTYLALSHVSDAQIPAWIAAILARISPGIAAIVVFVVGLACILIYDFWLRNARANNLEIIPINSPGRNSFTMAVGETSFDVSLDFYVKSKSNASVEIVNVDMNYDYSNHKPLDQEIYVDDEEMTSDGYIIPKQQSIIIQPNHIRRICLRRRFLAALPANYNEDDLELCESIKEHLNYSKVLIEFETNVVGESGVIRRISLRRRLRRREEKQFRLALGGKLLAVNNNEE